MSSHIKLVFLITAYKLPVQLVRLVNRLHDENSLILIHYDQKSPDSEFRFLKDKLKEIPSVVFLDRHRCEWGDFGHVEATIKGLNYLFERKISFHYFSLITGQDYPLTNPIKMRSFLSGRTRSNIEYSPAPVDWLSGGGRFRWQQIHFFGRGRYYNLPSPVSDLMRKLGPRYFGTVPIEAIFLGSSYFTLTYSHTEYLWDYIRKHPNYTKFFRRTLVPDEMFFQTILMNSELKDQVDNQNLRYIDWSERRSHPKVFKLEDFEKIKSSGALFARKFDSSVDSTLLDKIDHELIGCPKNKKNQ